MQRLVALSLALWVVACAGDAQTPTNSGAGGSFANTGGASTGTGGTSAVPDELIDACHGRCERGAEACPSTNLEQCARRCEDMGIDFCLGEATAILACEASASLDGFTCLGDEMPRYEGVECMMEEEAFDQCFAQLPPTDGPCADYCAALVGAGCPDAQCPDGCQWVTALSDACQAIQNAFYACAADAPDPCDESTCAAELQAVVACVRP